MACLALISSSLVFLSAREGAENTIQHVVQLLADIFCQKTQHKIAALLKQGILAAITAVGIRVGEVLRAIQFDRQTRLRIQQVNFHLPAFVKWDGQLRV